MHDTKNHTLWVEKYRPDTLDGYIGNDAMKAKFASYIASKDIPHLLLIGPAGTGKTTAAKILVKHIAGSVMFLNASDDNNIETVRTKIRGFVSTLGFNDGLKIVVLDEFDGFTRQGQSALRNLMEQFSDTARFILTANYAERLLEPIVSRSTSFAVTPPSKRDTAIHVAGILKKEGVSYAPGDMKVLIDAYFPDIRKIINEAQSSALTGALVVDQKAVIEGDFKLKIVELLKAKVSPKEKFQSIRKIIADSGVRDFTDLYRLLFDNVDEIAPGNVSAAILAIAEGQRWDTQVVDKEINMMSTMVELIKVIA